MNLVGLNLSIPVNPALVDAVVNFGWPELPGGRFNLSTAPRDLVLQVCGPLLPLAEQLFIKVDNHIPVMNWTPPEISVNLYRRQDGSGYLVIAAPFVVDGNPDVWNSMGIG